MTIRLNQWIFAALLVMSQTVLLVHQADIDHYMDPDECLICLVGAGQDNAATADFHQHTFFGEGPVSLVPVRVHPASFHTLTYRSRAPPCKTLHV
jgi:hypothetical protein